MRQRIIFNSIVDLTPLLDVVFILLFALLMSLSTEKNASDQKVDELASVLDMTETQLKEVQSENDQMNGTIQQIKEQQMSLNSSFVDWFTKEQEVEALLSNPQTQNLFDLSKTSESLFKMDFLANQFFFIDVKVDAANAYKVIINGTTTNIQLNGALFNDEEGKKIATQMLFDSLEKALSTKQGGYRYVLFTLSDDGKMYKYAFDLIWSVFGDIETKYGTDEVFKLQYITY